MLKLASDWNKQFSGVEDWSAWLAEGDEAEKLHILRRPADKGLPCGSESFVQALGMQIGRVLMHRPQGRPQKIRDGDKGLRPLCLPDKTVSFLYIRIGLNPR